MKKPSFYIRCHRQPTTIGPSQNIAVCMVEECYCEVFEERVREIRGWLGKEREDGEIED